MENLGLTCTCMHACKVTSAFETLCPAARQAPPSMGFSRQEYWSGLPWFPPRDFPNPKIAPASPIVSLSQVNSLLLSHQRSH